MMNMAIQLYELAVSCKCRSRSRGWWSPRYVQQLRKNVAELWQLYRTLPDPRLCRVDLLMRLILQELESALCGFWHDKKRITWLFFSLHNLPRAYLPTEHPMRISEEDALEYSRSWLEKANIHIG